MRKKNDEGGFDSIYPPKPRASALAKFRKAITPQGLRAKRVVGKVSSARKPNEALKRRMRRKARR